jgi:hypothetical protein
MFNLCNEQDITVAEAASRGWQLTYRRWLSPDLQVQIIRLRDLLDTVILVPEDDIPIWDWTKNGQFTVKSVYKDLSGSGIDRSFKHIWEAKIPLKNKVCLWLIWHNAIATKDTMAERGWTGNTRCQFFDQNENVHHLFFSCPAAKYVWSCVEKSVVAPTRPRNFSQFFWWFPQHVPASHNVHILGIASICWAIWKLRRACFEGKLINSPVELIYYSGVFMKNWAGLNSSTDQELIRRGGDELINTTMGAHAGASAAPLRLEDARIPSDVPGPYGGGDRQQMDGDAGSQ